MRDEEKGDDRSPRLKAQRCQRLKPRRKNLHGEWDKFPAALMNRLLDKTYREVKTRKMEDRWGGDGGSGGDVAQVLRWWGGCCT